MSYGADGQSDDCNHQCRHGYVKRWAPALHVIIQSGHGADIKSKQAMAVVA